MTEGPLSISDLVFARSGAGGFSLRLQSLRVDRGEVIALVGPSGTGKSTLLQLISGELLPDSGSIKVAGRKMNSLAEADRRKLRRQRIGVVAQTLSLIDYLTGFENILLVAGMESQARANRSRAKQLADSLEVSHTLGRRPARMSQGERQRIAICRALLLRPPVLLCDEPTGNLDANRGQRAMELMIDAARSDDAAVLIATHDDRLLPMADRVVSLMDLMTAEAE